MTKNKYIYVFICICILLLLLFIETFYMANKKGLHVDESLSFINAQSFSIFNDIRTEIPTGTYYGSTIKSFLICDNNSPASVKTDIKRMIKSGVHGSHPTPYFIMLRIWSTGYKLFNVSSFAIVGVTLNFIFLTVTYIFICLLMAKFFESNYLRAVGIIVAFFNTATISNVIFIRFYCMQMMFFSIISYYFVCLMKEKLNNENIFTRKKIIIFSILSILTITGGYFGTLYVIFLALILFFNKKILKNKKLYISLTSIMLILPVISKGFWTYIFQASDTKNAILKNFAPSNIIYNFSNIITHGLHDVCYYYFYVPTLLVIAFILFRYFQSNKPEWNIKSLFIEEKKLPLLLFFTTLLWAAIILWISSVKTARYYFAIYPVMSIIFPYLCTISKDNAKKLGAIFIIIYFLGAIFPKNFVNTAFAYSKVNYLFSDQANLFKYVSSGDTPVYIDEDFLKRKDLYIFRHYLPLYLIDDKKYHINYPKQKLPKHYYMLYIVHKDNDPYIFAAEILDNKLIKTLEF